MDWEVTITTRYCDAVGTNVTLMLRKDGSGNCTGKIKYNGKITKKKRKELKARSKKFGKDLACEGLQCTKLEEFRRSLFYRHNAHEK